MIVCGGVGQPEFARRSSRGMSQRAWAGIRCTSDDLRTRSSRRFESASRHGRLLTSERAPLSRGTLASNPMGVVRGLRKADGRRPAHCAEFDRSRIGPSAATRHGGRRPCRTYAFGRAGRSRARDRRQRAARRHSPQCDSPCSSSAPSLGWPRSLRSPRPRTRHGLDPHDVLRLRADRSPHRRHGLLAQRQASPAHGERLGRQLELSAPAAARIVLHRLDADGTVDYYCQIPPGCARVEARSLLLAAPHDAASPGKPYQLTGRAALPAGSTISIEADSGDSAATATVDAAGTSHATVTPQATTSYRAVAGDHASSAVQVLVLDRRVEASGKRHRGRIVVGTRILPASAGATVVLQLHLRERFGWWPVQRTRLDDASRARFTFRRERPVRARRARRIRRRHAAGAQRAAADPLAISLSQPARTPHARHRRLGHAIRGGTAVREALRVLRRRRACNPARRTRRRLARRGAVPGTQLDRAKFATCRQTAG